VKKVLIVAMIDSVHTGRWISQFDGEAIDFMLFPSTPHRRVHSIIKQRLNGGLSVQVRISKWMNWAALALGVADLFFANFFRAKLLANEINRFQPDAIHIMETQHAGYLTDRALNGVKVKPQVILSIWGSDLFWFQRFPKHRTRIKSVLNKVDLLVTECHRDREFALTLGFKGEFSESMPATGGMNTELLAKKARQIPAKERKWIAVKGYSGFVGQGKDAIKVISEIESQITDFSVMVYSAGLGTQWFARRLQKQMGTRLVIARKHKLSNAEIQEMFLKSRVALGLSLSDGLPATVKEAMCMGAFPVQTLTSCAGEWFKDGVSGILVEPNQIKNTAAVMMKVLRDDDLVESAVFDNLIKAEKLFSENVLKEKSKNLYSSISKTKN
jgi:glycosyltransferase involved in cell wall biosynthesis